ncbi:helix-turn-helix domain-containing protein [Streptacidiphilus sp. N1-3]|uniref:Helix-turn-helix domain-containing protein n=1 Tax=Streptacidiphilus alkalitolerans TaxID=3342712 RepID=A0ABV6X136_9ACTN
MRNNSRFGDILRRHRIRRGVTQRQLADLSTVSVRAIRDLELGRVHRPRVETVRLIGAGLGLSGNQLAELESSARVGSVPDLDGPEPTGPEDDRLERFAPPQPLDALIGRAAELALLRDLLVPGTHRLGVVTGLPGVGKTRLALQTAALLRGSAGFGVRWSPPPEPALEPLLEPFTDHGRPGRPLLLVLDDVRPGDPRLPQAMGLLRSRPELRVLCTAHSRLGIPGERVLPLWPLGVPDRPDRTGPQDPAALAAMPSVQLLCRSIDLVRDDFRIDRDNAAAVAAVVRRVDGIPAALEAVAALFLLLDPDTVLDCVEHDLWGSAEDGLLDLLTLLHGRTTALDQPGSRALRLLAAHGPDWSIGDAVLLTGLPAAACARTVRQFLAQGLVRPSHEGSRSRFQVLELVRAVLAGNDGRAAPALSVPLPQAELTAAQG